MKKTYLLLTILLVALTANSCSTDFDIASDWKEITVVYGLLDASKETQYIKINKAFLSSDVNALDMAAVADSLYHEGELEVILEEVDESGNIKNTATLSRVNAADEGIEKQEGLFANTPYFLYKFDGPINPENIYKLTINTADGDTYTAETTVIGDFKVIQPNPLIELNIVGTKMYFRWKQEEGAFTYDLDLYLNFREYRIVDGEEIDEARSIKWNAFSNIDGDSNTSAGSVNYEVPTDAFYSFIDKSLDVDATIVKRDFKSITLKFHVGSEELSRFNQVSRANTGVTSSQVSPVYTNLEGGALGIFSTRYTKEIVDYDLTLNSYYELACGEITDNLKFAVHPSTPTYPNCQ